LALSEWRLTPDEINHQWTEECLGLMFRKRNQRLRALADEMEKLREEKKATPRSERPSRPRRVNNDAFFARINTLAQKGGSGRAPR